jgi:hypothetical protein
VTGELKPSDRLTRSLGFRLVVIHRLDPQSLELLGLLPLSSTQRFAGWAMPKSIICSLILAAFVAAARYGLHQLENSVELLSFMAICFGLTALIIAAAFAYDWWEARDWH